MQNRAEVVHHLLTRNVADVIEGAHLELALQGGKKLRVKFGIDPTSPDLHIGHAVVLRKLREFQDLGHKVVLIIGDFTAQIGDPSGRDTERKPLPPAEIKKNMKEYLAHASKVLHIKKAEIRYNSEWFKKGGIEMAIRLASAGSLQQVLHRADFKKRLAANRDITLLEAIYPIFQGYDSVAVKADVELGGTDQTFNLIMGRRVQRHFGMKEQDVMTVPLLEGTDGVRKMSKSYKNYIGLGESAKEMFGKIMSVPDALVGKYFLLCTEIDEASVKRLAAELSPRDLKERLGVEIVKLYHGELEAEQAASEFKRFFSEKQIDVAKLPPVHFDVRPITLLDMVFEIKAQAKKSVSRSEAHRLVEQGAVRIDGVPNTDPRYIITPMEGMVVQLGKKDFFRISAR